MKEEHEIFKSMMERDSRVHVEIGDDVSYEMKGEGPILF
jgi:hypothetical protein